MRYEHLDLFIIILFFLLCYYFSYSLSISGNLVRDGLRTLVFGRRRMSEEEYSHFAHIYHEVKTTITNREEHVYPFISFHHTASIYCNSYAPSFFFPSRFFPFFLFSFFFILMQTGPRQRNKQLVCAALHRT